MWFNTLFGSRRRPSTTRRQPVSFRLTVESLEDRSVPSTTAAVSPPDAVASLVSPVANALAQSFQVSGTFAHTGNKVGTIAGHATPLGSFTGTFNQNSNGVGNQAGTFTMVFDSGSLACSYQVSLDHDTNEFVGTWQIISGTGSLAGASGGGSITFDHASAGNVSLSGSISQ
jgi:hypothetical protein